MNVTEQDYELLSQYLDGELSLVQGRLVEQRLENEPALNACFAGLQSLQSELDSAYRKVANAPVPERITALLQPAATPIVPLPHRRVAGWGFALAASLLVAVSATLVTQWSQNSPLPAGADALLANTLEHAPSRASGWDTLDDGRQVRPVLSYQSQTGDWCREYLVADEAGNWHAVACRGAKGWATMAIAATEPAASSEDYRPAGANDSDEVAEFINRNAADIPLDLHQEAQLIGSNWQ
jgi:hypothetical protein